MPEIDFAYHGVSFTGKYMPAMDIGGDFYDVVHTLDKHISVIIGDVSGHGIAAALLTSMLKMMIRNLSAKYDNPDEILSHMNNEFYYIFENGDHEMYACVFCGIFDIKKRRLHYSNAGAALPIFVDAYKKAAFELESSGLPIGLIKDSQYESKTLEYRNGDTLMFYTDGLMDAFYKDNPDEFIQGLKKLLLEAQSLESPREIIDLVLSSYSNYGAIKNRKYELDDVSIILCKM
jgi:sigma-B regulation protein RsbU (phosphoserine phosphatase)